MLRADPAEIAEMADLFLRASRDISVAVAGVSDALSGVLDDADVAVGRLVAVLEADTDALYGVAFAYDQVDDDAAHRFERYAR